MTNTLLRALAVVALVAGSASASFADTFYVDPVNGSPGGNGSSNSPWRTLQQVVEGNLIESRQYSGSQLVAKNSGAPIGAGDTILLRNGNHGYVELAGYFNTSTITVRAQSGHTPSLYDLELIGAAKWTFQDLIISPEGGSSNQPGIVIIGYNRSRGDCADVTIEGCTVRSASNSSGWSANEWVSKTKHGVMMEAKDGIVRDNLIKNIDFGVRAMRATGIIVDGNVIENFRGDGLRIGDAADGMVVENNTVKNSYDVDSNHDDGLQVYWGSVATKNVIIRGNVIINRTDPNQAHAGPMQGMGLFDGPYENYLIENNVVLTHHWHGIAVYGAIDCQIINNTTHDPNDQYGVWIQIGEMTGVTNRNVVIRNNVTHRVWVISGNNITQDHNLILGDPSAVFVDPQKLDVRLKSTSAAIDAGSSTLAPSTDIAGTSRPQGSAVDIGAYEFPVAAPPPPPPPPPPPAPTPQPDLVVLQGQSTVPHDGLFAFGTVELGVPSARTFTIENRGAAALTLTGQPTVSMSGTGADFSLTGPPATQLAPGASTQFTVHFDPQLPGPQTVTVSVESDDPDQGVYTVDLGATGTTDEAVVMTRLMLVDPETGAPLPGATHGDRIAVGGNIYHDAEKALVSVKWKLVAEGKKLASGTLRTKVKGDGQWQLEKAFKLKLAKRLRKRFGDAAQDGLLMVTVKSKVKGVKGSRKQTLEVPFQLAPPAPPETP